MKKLLLSTLIAVSLVSCSNPQEEAAAVMAQFSTDLDSIENLEQISAFELSTQIKECVSDLESAIAQSRAQFSKSEDLDIYDTESDIADFEPYCDILEKLTQKSLKSIAQIAGKSWINSEANPLSIFKIEANSISFINFKNKLSYSIIDGNISFSNPNNPIFFELKGDKLTVMDFEGNSEIYSEAKLSDIIKATWVDKWGVKYILKDNGLGVYISDEGRKYDTSYKIKGDIIDIYWPGGNYKYLPSDTLKFADYGDYSFYRIKSSGPYDISFLFTGDASKKVETEISYSSNEVNNWDKVLDEYEKYIDEYIKFYNKAKSGDTSAVMEYMKLLDSAETLDKKLNNAKGDLTTAQSSRLLKLQQKLANAVM